MTSRYQATPRGRQWHPEPTPSRWVVPLKAVGLLLLLLSTGINDIRF